MTPVLRTTCPYCGEITHLAAAEIFLALHGGGDGTTGDYSYTCPQCTRIVASTGSVAASHRTPSFSRSSRATA